MCYSCGINDCTNESSIITDDHLPTNEPSMDKKYGQHLKKRADWFYLIWAVQDQALKFITSLELNPIYLFFLKNNHWFSRFQTLPFVKVTQIYRKTSSRRVIQGSTVNIPVRIFRLLILFKQGILHVYCLAARKIRWQIRSSNP